MVNIPDHPTHLPDPATLAERYAADGYVVVESLFSGKECDALKEEAQRVLREHGRRDLTVYVGAAVHSAAFRKLAEKTFASPWHIDAFYWAGTRPKLSVWIPLDDVSAANGTLKVVRGSHRHEWSVGTGNLEQTGGEFGNVIEEESWNAADEVICELPRGSAVIFSDRTVHASCPNTAGADRFTIISTYHAPAEDEPFDTQFAARHVVEPATTAPGTV